ncbi:MAG: hypothetical protein LC641_13735 [Spirochaeta sp.]|nr:hypothetical protein [Spirochaeta sp.]
MFDPRIFIRSRVFGTLVLLLILSASLSSCTAIGKRMDRAGLEAMAERVTENFNPGTPAELEAFLSEIDIEQETRATTDEVAQAHESVDGVPPLSSRPGSIGFCISIYPSFFSFDPQRGLGSGDICSTLSS